MEQSRAETRRELRQRGAFKKSRNRDPPWSLYNQPVMVKPVDQEEKVTEGEPTYRQTRKNYQRMLRSTITIPFFGKNRSTRHSKVRMCNKKHTDGRKEHNKIHKHLSNAI